MKNLISLICFIVITYFLFHTNNSSNSTKLQNYNNEAYNQIRRNITLKVLLVEFQDVKHRQPSYPNALSLSSYSFNDFRNLLFSDNKYYSPNMYSPDGEKVYGSLRDYYNIMSNGKFKLNGYVLNNKSADTNIPDWIQLDNNKKYYDSNRVDQFRNEARIKAKNVGLDINTNDSTFLVIVYAGHTYRGTINTLTPHAFTKDYEYIIGERFAISNPYREERDDSSLSKVAHFSHIGIHAHEFGHLLGFEHHGGGLDNQFWGLMSSGCYNGPNYEGACPAPLNPYIRWNEGWIKCIAELRNVTKKLKYNLSNPEIYIIKDQYTENYFLIEFRKFNKKMLIGNNLVDDYNSYIKNLSLNRGVLVWRKRNGNFVKLLYSSGTNSIESDKHIFPGKDGVKVVSPWSDERLCKPGYYWVPNTYPSLNCALEIVSIKNDYCLVDFYNKDPWKSSPTYPKNLINNSRSNVEIGWTSNKEPDLKHYNIYKMKDSKYYKPLGASCINSFIDTSEILNFNDIHFNEVSYKITAIDSSNKESSFSKPLTVRVVDSLKTGKDKSKSFITKFILFQNSPNPFNNETEIKFTLPYKCNVQIDIYDILSEKIKCILNEFKLKGNYTLNFNGTSLSSGIYFYRMQAGNYVDTKKMIFLK